MARDYQTKANVGALPDTITATRFGAGEFNSIAVELENAVTTSDQTLAPADGTGEVTDQLAMALAIYGAGGAFYHADTGAVNAYVLTPISPKESPPAYFDGFTVIFEPGTPNTTASTVNVATLGVKNITYADGNPLTGGELSGSCGIKYNLSDDRFELLFSSGGLAGLGFEYIVDATQADQGATSANPDTLTVFDVAALVGTATNATIRFIHNPVAGVETLYSFDTSLDLSTYTLLAFKFDQGAKIQQVTGDEVFTIYSPMNICANDNQKIISDDLVLFSYHGGIVRPQWFGAVGDGVTDCTTAFQNAVDAAGTGATIRFERGAYLLSDTINLLSDQHIIGNGYNTTVFRRFDDYGDTLYWANAASGSVKGIWFYHSTLPAIGFTTLDDLATSGAHIRMDTVQGALVEDCWFWRLPYGIRIEQGALCKINRCNFTQSWNTFEVAAQEGIASIAIGYTAYAQLIDITNCYFAGSNSGAQDVDITTTDTGLTTVPFTSTNAGPLYGIDVYTCEGLTIRDCYMGGQSQNSIAMQPNGILSQVRILDNFFDSAGYQYPMIDIRPQSDGESVNMFVLSDNVFNGELYGKTCIESINLYGTSDTLINFKISNNIMSANIGTSVFLRRIRGGIINNNSIHGYNARNLTAGADNSYANAIYVDNSFSTGAYDNLVGGAVNSGALGAYTYGDIVFSGTNVNVCEKGTLHNGTGSTAVLNGKVNGHIVNTTTTYPMDGSEDMITTDSTGGAYNITLMSNPPDNKQVVIKDVAGITGTNNVTVVGTINGAVNLVMATNYQVVRVFSYGGNWFTF